MQPFALIDIYTDQIFAQGCVDSSTSQGHYPAFLDDAELLVLRDYADTMGVVHSYANNGIRIKKDPDNGCDTTRIDFTVDPPRHATSAILLVTGNAPLQRNGSDPLAYLTFHHADSSAIHDTLRVGEHLRDWHTYRPFAAEDCSDFIHTPPTSPESGEVWTGTTTAPPDTLWYDVTELLFPPASLEQPVTSISLAADSSGAYCDTGGKLGLTFAASGTVLHGISLATDFRCLNDETDPVETQHQYQPWGDESYGGYVYNGDVVGADDDLGKFGCALTCCAMLLTYYGTPCTPPELNEFLRESRYYSGMPRGKVVYVSGQAVGDTVRVRRISSNYRFKVGHGLLIENDGQYIPTADLDVVAVTDTSRTAIAIIAARPDTMTSIAIGNEARSYDDVAWSVPGKYSGGSGFEVTLSSSVEEVEQALASMKPVVLGVGSSSSTCTGHFVVTDGMRPSWGSSPLRGTYMIHDPGHAAPDELMHPRYGNSFSKARILTPAGSGSDGSVSLGITLSGAARMRLTDPGMGLVIWDDELGAYTTTIPGAYGDADVSLTALGDSIPWSVSDVIEVPSTIPGDYLLWVIGSEDSDYALSVLEQYPDGSVSADSHVGSIDVGEINYFLVHVPTEPDSLQLLTELDPADVGPTEQELGEETTLRVTPNPSRRSTTISFELPSRDRVVVDIIDVEGRKVATLVDSYLAGGLHTIPWSGRRDNGRPVPAGVYWVQLTTGNHRDSERVIVLK